MSQSKNDIDPDRLAGREYHVKLSYTVDYFVTVTAGPEEWQAVEEAELVASPAGPVDASEWDLVHEDVEQVRNIWMGDPDAPDAAGWLEEPHVPSEETYWDDSKHFDSDDSSDKTDASTN